jgi:CO dehydrogenase/acetyl-CoA synthase beta subunit
VGDAMPEEKRIKPGMEVADCCYSCRYGRVKKIAEEDVVEMYCGMFDIKMEPDNICECYKY